MIRLYDIYLKAWFYILYKAFDFAVHFQIAT